MGTTAGFRETVIDLIRARHPILLVETHEAERVMATVASVAADPYAFRSPRQVMAFTLSRGLHVPGDPGRGQTPEAALAAAMNVTRPTIFVFFDLHHFLGGDGGQGPDPILVRALLDVATAFKSGPIAHSLVLVAPGLALPPDLEKVVSVVDLPLPDAEEIDEVLAAIIEANADGIRVELGPGERERLVQAARGLTRWEAENAFARAIAGDRRLDASDIARVVDEKRQTIRKSELLEFIAPAGSIEDIGGLDNLKQWLVKRNGSWLPEAGRWGIGSPKGILITGVPGCGKSLTAKCMSSLWGLPLLRLDVGKVFSGLVGSSEQNMRAALRLAEAVAPSILWIDEIEKGFGSATSSSSGDSGTSQRVFGTFLTWLQEKTSPVFVIATANKIDALPPEFLRKGRFDEIFFVDLPTPAEREEIWSLHLRRRLAAGEALGSHVPPSPEVVGELARRTDGFSGAEIEQAVVSACFDAFAERRPLAWGDLEHAVRSTVPLSVTQAEQVDTIRRWAATRAVGATARTAP
jgi:ATP-dependent 26S proteasome regulatory subunit